MPRSLSLPGQSRCEAAWVGLAGYDAVQQNFDDNDFISTMNPSSFSLSLPGQRRGGAALAGLAGHVACYPNFDQIDIHAVLINWLCIALPGQRRSGAAWVGLAGHDSGHDSGACCGAPRPARQVRTRAVLLGQPFEVAVHQRLHFEARLWGPVLEESFSCSVPGVLNFLMSTTSSPGLDDGMSMRSAGGGCTSGWAARCFRGATCSAAEAALASS